MPNILVAPPPSTDAHAAWPPSSAHRWVECPASVLPAPRDLSDKTAAKVGTAAHLLCAYALSQGLQAADEVSSIMLDVPGATEFHLMPMRPESGYPVRIEPEMRMAYRMMYAFAAGADRIWIECKLKLIAGTIWGTADLVALHKRALYIVDLKYGTWPIDSPRHNRQLYVYAAAASRRLHALGVVEANLPVIVGAVQPRRSDGQCVLQSQIGFVEDMLPESAIARYYGATMYPEKVHAGTWCEYCLHRHDCTALREYASRVASDTFGDLTWKVKAK